MNNSKAAITNPTRAFGTETKGTVLIVDDIHENLRLLTQLLKSDGYAVRAALNGSIALTAVHTTRPDLILLDIVMPELDGFETCKRLKALKATRDIPIIFLSALSGPQNITKGFEGTNGESGTGFGMPLVKKFISAYGGEIRVTSVEKTENEGESGTEVTLKLQPALSSDRD